MKINYTYAIAVVIILAAIFLRIDSLMWETYGYGEMEIKEVADSYIAGNFVNNFYLFDTPPFGKYVFAAAEAVLGSTEFALRVVSVIFGVLTVIATFFFAKKLYNIKLGVLATAITGFSIIHLQLSRYGQFEAMLGFAYLAIIYFLWSMAENRGKYDFVLLGVSLGIAVSIKFTSIIMLVIVAAYFLYLRHIKLSIKPGFCLSIRNNILKALVIALLVFMVTWPFGLSRLHTEANITVDYGGVERTQEVKADVPIMVLSFFRRIFTSVGEPVQHSLAMGTPIINYVLLYFTKEFILIIPMILVGVYIMAKKPQKNDVLIALTVIIFILLLSFQRTSISYRHIAPIIPFLAIVGSRWIYVVKEKWQLCAIVLVSIALSLNAYLAAPSYALSFNVLKGPLGITDSEMRFSEGMKDTISYMSANCTNVFTSNSYKLMTREYYSNFSSANESAACVVKGYGIPDTEIDKYIGIYNCSLVKTIEKKSTKLIEIYGC